MTEAGLKRLAEDEGFSGVPYKCTADKTTIGFGFNLEAWPLTPAECLPILKSRADKVKADLANRIGFFYRLPEAAQDVLVNMGYQMGVAGVMGFKKTLEYMRDGRWEDAYHEMQRSDWVKDTPNRCRRLADVIRSLG